MRHLETQHLNFHILCLNHQQTLCLKFPVTPRSMKYRIIKNVVILMNLIIHYDDWLVGWGVGA